MKLAPAVLLGLVAVAGFAAPASAVVGVFPLNAKLLYDPATGNVKINPNGFEVSSFNLEDALADGTNVFAGSAAPTFPAGQFSVTDTDTKVAWTTLTTRFTTTQDLGNIALPGLTAVDLIAQLSGAPGAQSETIYTAQGVTGKQSFDLVVVPEPAAVTMLGLAGVGLMARRRRTM